MPRISRPAADTQIDDLRRKNNRLTFLERLNQVVVPTGRIYVSSGAQTITHGAGATKVTLGSTDWLLGGMTKSGQSLVIPYDGVYGIDALLKFTGVSATGNLELAVYQNGSVARNMQQTTIAGTLTMAGFDPIKCTAADVIDVWVINATSADVTVDSCSLAATFTASV